MSLEEVRTFLDGRNGAEQGVSLSFYEDPVSLSQFTDLDALFLDENIVLDVINGQQRYVSFGDRKIEIPKEAPVQMIDRATQFNPDIDILYQANLPEKQSYTATAANSTKLEDFRRNKFYNYFDDIGTPVALPSESELPHREALEQLNVVEDAQIATAAKQYGNAAVITHDRDFAGDGKLQDWQAYDVPAFPPNVAATAYNAVLDGHADNATITLFDVFDAYDFDHPVATNILDYFRLDRAERIARHIDPETLPEDVDAAFETVLLELPTLTDGYRSDRYTTDAVNTLYGIANVTRKEGLRQKRASDHGSFPEVDSSLYQHGTDCDGTTGALLDDDLVEDLFLLRTRNKPFDGTTISYRQTYDLLDELAQADDLDAYVLRQTGDKLQNTYGNPAEAFYDQLTAIAEEIDPNAITDRGATLSTARRNNLTVLTPSNRYNDATRELGITVAPPDDYLRSILD